ncbi:uncharacterized protein LOC132832634 [Hemiscyllium ocellatum]|uniref:uncharacterized protein LOC132832634 n=1 Tax=Hemiscyllium ocellatum TaxID=170820 RepID=UPI002966BB3E|nr:uncharacterized protein LOC132832634 [Hemiscyllium ocellatum]
MLLILLSISLCFSRVSPDTDSLTVIYTAVSGIKDFPEVTNIAIVKGVQLNYHDTNIGRMVPRQQFMVDYFDAEYWQYLTAIANTLSGMAKENLNTMMKSTNRTSGIHTFQWIAIAEVTDDGSIKRSMRVGFDGKDYLSLDPDRMRWIATNHNAVKTKEKWNADQSWNKDWETRLEQRFVQHLKRYLEAGKQYFGRKVQPEVYISRREPNGQDKPLTLSCLVTGFYPADIEVTWLRNREVMSETYSSGVRPNHDGTHQIQKEIEINAGDEDQYSCQIEHSSLAEAQLYQWEIPENSVVRSHLILLIGLFAAMAAIFGIIIWKRPWRGSPSGTYTTAPRTNVITVIYTVVSGIKDFPEITNSATVNGVITASRDSKTQQCIPRQQFMAESFNVNFWDYLTDRVKIRANIAKETMSAVMKRTNQTSGIHTFQQIATVEVSDDGSIKTSMRFGFDGKDFISLEPDTMRWIASNPIAVMTKEKWESDDSWNNYWKRHLEELVVEYLNRYLEAGKDYFKRKIQPKVFISRREPNGQDKPLTLSCLVTGFYPVDIEVTWLRNGEVMSETQSSRVRPNHDGTHQIQKEIEINAGDEDQYSCQIEHSSLAEGKLYQWENLKSNWLHSHLGSLIASMVILLAVIVGIFGIIIWKRSRRGSPSGTYTTAPNTFTTTSQGTEGGGSGNRGCVGDYFPEFDRLGIGS